MCSNKMKKKLLRIIVIVVLFMVLGIGINKFNHGKKYINEYRDMSEKDIEVINEVIELAKEKVGFEYVWGGKGEIMTEDRLNELIDYYGESYYPLKKEDYIGKQALDCSGLTYWLYKEVTGAEIGLSTTDQEKVLKNNIIDEEDIRPGDLIFTPGHVVIYIGEGKIINAFSKFKYPLGGIKYGNLRITNKSVIYRPIDYIIEI